MRRAFIATCVAVLLPAGALAQVAPNPITDPVTAEEANRAPVRSLRLTEVLGVAVRQNPTLAASAIDVAIAESDILAAYGIDDWVIAAELQGSTTRSPRIEGNPVQLVADDSLQLSVGVSRDLPSGGSFALEAGTSWRGSDYATVVQNQEIDSSTSNLTGSLVATFSQPLLRGFGRRVARAPLRQAEAARDITSARRMIAASEAVRQVIRTYWDLAYAQREIEIHEQSLELAEEQLRITRAAISAGAVAPTEAGAVEQAIASREQMILGAEVQLMEKAVELRRLAGLEIGVGEISLLAGDVLDAPDRPLDLDRVLQLASEQNPQLVALQLGGEGARINVEVAEDRLRPSLDFSATAGPSLTSSSSEGEGPGGDGLQQAYSLSGQLVYTHVLGNRSATGRAERARAEARQVSLDLATARREVSVGVVQVVNLVRLANKRIEVSEKSIRLAERNVDIEKRRFQVGEATNFEVLERQEELAQARLAHARAVVDYLQALTEVDTLTGELLARFGMRVDQS